MQASLDKECMWHVIAALEVGLAIKIGNNWKLKSLQTSIDFSSIIFDENNDVKICGLEWKSRLAHSTQQHVVA